MNVTIRPERLIAAEYIEFLKNTDLGSQYPKENFNNRIERLVQNVSISLVARSEQGEVVGVCFGITDFAYWLFITDLGVIRSMTGQGIGSQLIQKALEIAGGEDEIVMYTCANEDAIPFYEKLGMKKSTDITEYNRMPWTPFTVE